MAETVITEQDRYFQIAGGNTVLQRSGKKWLRWDTRDGVLETNIPWSADDSQLKEISREEAIALMK